MLQNRVIVRPRQRARGFKRIRVRTGGRRRGNKRQPPRAKSLPNFSRSIDGAPDEGDDWEVRAITISMPKTSLIDAKVYCRYSHQQEKTGALCQKPAPAMQEKDVQGSDDQKAEGAREHQPEDHALESYVHDKG